VTVGLLLAACTSSGPSAPATPRPASFPPGTGVGSTPGSTPVPVPVPVPVTARPALVLTADLRQRPASWRRVAFIPYGPRPFELGAAFPPVHASLPLVPRSFTIGPDGSLWILDTVKRRVAHYTVDGRYLGAVGGLTVDRVDPRPRDVAFWAGRLVVLDEFDLAASLREVRNGRLGPTVAVEDSTGQPVGLLYVYPSAAGGAGLSDGYTALGLLGAGPHGVGEVLAGDPAGFRLAPGLPVGRATRLGVGEYRARSFRMTSTTPSGRVVQPVRLRMRVGGSHPHDIPAIFSEHFEAAGDGAGFLFVQGSPAATADAVEYGGGRWFLRFPTDGSPLVWERLPTPAVPDEYQTRHLALDDAGHVFFMEAFRSGVAVDERCAAGSRC